MKTLLLILCLCSSAPAIERPIYSTGQDQAAAIQAVYDAASDGDVIKLVPQNGQNFVINSTLKFQGKRVNVQANNASLVGSANPLLQLGGTLSGGTAAGVRGYGDVRGGTFYGNVTLVNYCYSKFHPAAVSGTLTIDLDAVASYNRFEGNYGNGRGPAIVVNQRNNTAWATRNVFTGCNIVPAPAGQGTITQANKSGNYFSLKFYDCDFEGGGQLFDCGRIQAVFLEPEFWDGHMKLGTCAQDSMIVMQNHGGAFDDTGDPRVRLVGVNW